MKLLDYIKQLPIGEVVMNKRFFAVLKRKGLIFDYSFGATLNHAICITTNNVKVALNA